MSCDMYNMAYTNITNSSILSRVLAFFVACSSVKALENGSYNVDIDHGLGRRYDGIGGVSGGGATSKLLVNYAEPYRSRILDYLFKPNFGASLQILKVEIGGDAQSTDGTESSHMHESWDESYDRGYEWWLMVEAKKRNPDIKLYGLPWAFPGWVALGTQYPFLDPNITAWYITKWVQGAKIYYQLDIDYVGIWNERAYNSKYIKVLRETLDRNGFNNTEIVAADNTWFISAAVLNDTEIAEAVSIIGAHYPGTNSSKLAQMTNKPLWSSEDYSTFNDGVGAGCWARIINQNYVNGLMTSTIAWNLIASYYEDLPFGRDGLMTAQEPWSGHYVVQSPIWSTAHTTYFTSIGWQYLAHGSGVGHLDKGGSYVSLLDTEMQNFTMIIETMTHDHSECIRPELPPYTVSPQNATFMLQGSLANLTKLYVWYSKLNFDGIPDRMFVKLPAMQVQSGRIQLELGLDEVYTLTTVDRAPPQLYPAPPRSKDFPLPYGDDFEGYAINSESYNFVPQVGVWEIRKSEFKGQGQVNRQVMLRDACYWCKPSSVPINIGGNYNWSNIFVEMNVFIPSVNGTTGVFLGARVNKGGCGMSDAKGIFFALHVNSNNYTVYSDYNMSKVLTSGPLKVIIQPDYWYHMGLVVTGNESYGFFDVDQIFEVKIPSQPTNGFAAYGATSYGLADYDNLMILDSSVNEGCNNRKTFKQVLSGNLMAIVVIICFY